MFVRVWAGERDLVTILVSTISFLMYISVVMDCVTVRVLNLSSILSSNGCNFHTDFDLLSFFLFIRCVGTGGLCGALRLQVFTCCFPIWYELLFTHFFVRLLVRNIILCGHYAQMGHTYSLFLFTCILDGTYALAIADVGTADS